jgi:hypothetical protein
VGDRSHWVRADTNGAVNITDGIRILNVLFLGIGAILCDDAADADDNGAVNITLSLLLEPTSVVLTRPVTHSGALQ